LALVAFAILMYAFQLTLVFYNAMLSKIATPENYARVSGLGFAWGWIGGILGIVGVLPFVNGTLPATSSSPRADAVLPSALLFGGLYVISLILMYHRGALSWAKSTGRVSQHNLIQPFREIWLFAKRNPTLKIFLASYILYADAVLTIQNNASIYLQQVMHFGDNAKAILFLLLLGGAAIGGYASFAAIGRFGLRIVMRGILVGWVTLAIAATVTYSKPLFVVLFACTGVLFGSLWNSSRVIFTNLVPIRWGGQYFGLYSSFDRLATLLGPLLWSAPLVVIGDTTATPYRISMALIAALLLASLVVFWRIKSLHKDTA
jgi:UMF1 family MFS transporter